MTAFIRRFRETPGLETLTEIEQIALVDQTPRTPVTGVGTGTLLIIGEFEDGPFNKPLEVFGENDELNKFGGFGYQYGSAMHQNACARLHLGELWNGNGFLKGKFLRPRRKIICRVNSSIGTVRFSLAAALRSGEGPFRLAHNQSLSFTTDASEDSVSSTAITAINTTAEGAAFPGDDNHSQFTGGEQIRITIDNLPDIIVSFLSTDQTPAQVASRINSFLGYPGATANEEAHSIDFVNIIKGSSGKITLGDMTHGALAQIGHTAGTTTASAENNVANVTAVTASELVVLIDNPALRAINVRAIEHDSRVICYRTGSPIGTLQVADSALAQAIGIQVDTTMRANIGPADTIRAGTRVKNGNGIEWLTMRTLRIAEGTSMHPSPGTYEVEVRHALDNGTGGGTDAGTVTTVVDFPSNRFVEVINPSNLSAALSEDQLDVRYEQAFDATLDTQADSREVTLSLCARRSDAVVRKGRSNAITASDEANFGRSFHTRAPLGVSPDAALEDVAIYRHDRVFYTYPGWRVRIPEIAKVGETGGIGFSNNGIITIGADGPLAYINSVLQPEENSGQHTGLLTFVIGIEAIEGVEWNRQLFVAFKKEGICGPRINRSGAAVYQSKVTTSLQPGRTTQKRRKFADFVQDSFAAILLPYSKKLATDAREAGIDAVMDQFLGNLLSADQPEMQRIAGYSLVNTTISML